VHANDGAHDVTQDVTITVTNITRRRSHPWRGVRRAGHSAVSFPHRHRQPLSHLFAGVRRRAWRAHRAHRRHVQLHGRSRLPREPTLSASRPMTARSIQCRDLRPLNVHATAFHRYVGQRHLRGQRQPRVEAGTGTDTFSFNFKLTDRRSASVGQSSDRRCAGQPTRCSPASRSTSSPTARWTTPRESADRQALLLLRKYQTVWNALPTPIQQHMQTGLAGGAIRMRSRHQGLSGDLRRRGGGACQSAHALRSVGVEGSRRSVGHFEHQELSRGLSGCCPGACHPSRTPPLRPAGGTLRVRKMGISDSGRRPRERQSDLGHAPGVRARRLRCALFI